MNRTSENWETAVAAHVEALVALGWHWEGRYLAPRYDASRETVNVCTFGITNAENT